MDKTRAGKQFGCCRRTIGPFHGKYTTEQWSIPPHLCDGLATGIPNWRSCLLANQIEQTYKIPLWQLARPDDQSRPSKLKLDFWLSFCTLNISHHYQPSRIVLPWRYRHSQAGRFSERQLQDGPNLSTTRKGWIGGDVSSGGNDCSPVSSWFWPWRDNKYFAATWQVAIIASSYKLPRDIQIKSITISGRFPWMCFRPKSHECSGFSSMFNFWMSQMSLLQVCSTCEGGHCGRWKITKHGLGRFVLPRRWKPMPRRIWTKRWDKESPINANHSLKSPFPAVWCSMPWLILFRTVWQKNTIVSVKKCPPRCEDHVLQELEAECARLRQLVESGAGCDKGSEVHWVVTVLRMCFSWEGKLKDHERCTITINASPAASSGFHAQAISNHDSTKYPACCQSKAKEKSWQPWRRCKGDVVAVNGNAAVNHHRIYYIKVRTACWSFNLA